MDTAQSTPSPRPTGCNAPTAAVDPRDIRNGTIMLTAGYLDQPCVCPQRPRPFLCVSTPIAYFQPLLPPPFAVVHSASPVSASLDCDILGTGRWICSITYDDAHEGGSGEHIVAFWSDDVGKTWSTPVSVRPPSSSTHLHYHRHHHHHRHRHRSCARAAARNSIHRAPQCAKGRVCFNIQCSPTSLVYCTRAVNCLYPWCFAGRACSNQHGTRQRLLHDDRGAANGCIRSRPHLRYLQHEH
jgi:hypothetical protein